NLCNLDSGGRWLASRCRRAMIHQPNKKKNVRKNAPDNKEGLTQRRRIRALKKMRLPVPSPRQYALRRGAAFAVACCDCGPAWPRGATLSSESLARMADRFDRTSGCGSLNGIGT